MPHMITIVGLGPGDLDRVGDAARRRLLDPDRRVIVRTLEHPAARRLAELRDVASGDDLYEARPTFDEVYEALAERVVAAAADGGVVLAVPGSPTVAERTVGLIRERAAEEGVDVEILAAESFLDRFAAAAGFDLFGVQILDGHDLPDPLWLHLPTVIGQVDAPIVMADVQDRLRRTVPDSTPLIVAIDLGTDREQVVETTLGTLDPELAGLRTSLYLPAVDVGLPGVVQVMRRLRGECPWDRRQTHHSLVKNLVEETFELVEALSALPVEAPGGEPDFGAYADVEEELGDVLLQVLFHATMAREARAFDIEDIAEQLRRKLVRRHPHVFGDVEAGTAAEVLANWERIKQAEKQRTSLMDDIPAGLPGMERAAKVQRRAASVGFDWDGARPVVDKVEEELRELEAVLDDRAAAEDELGDLLFSIVNLARHLDLDPEVAVRRAVDRFEERFRWMEEQGLESRPLDDLWEAAKESHERERDHD
jgi:tetrapyrrole methylase family protein/MazG family protein